MEPQRHPGYQAATSFAPVTSSASKSSFYKTFPIRTRNARVAGLFLVGSILVAVSAPTARDVRVAEPCGMTLLAIARGQDFEIFSHPRRRRPQLDSFALNSAATALSGFAPTP